MHNWKWVAHEVLHRTAHEIVYESKEKVCFVMGCYYHITRGDCIICMALNLLSINIDTQASPLDSTLHALSGPGSMIIHNEQRS
jgi:hypothetical protein